MCPPKFHKLLYKLFTTLYVVSDCAPPIKKSFLRPCLVIASTDQYRAVSATCTTQCFHVRSSHVHTQNSHAKTARRDLAVKRRLKRVWVFMRAFYAKWSANSLRASALRAGRGYAPTLLMGPTTLQILATPLPSTLPQTTLHKEKIIFSTNWGTN